MWFGGGGGMGGGTRCIGNLKNIAEVGIIFRSCSQNYVVQTPGLRIIG